MRTRFSTGRLIALGVTFAVTLALIAPGAWGTALAQTAGQPDPAPTATGTEIAAGSGGSVSSGGVGVQVPAGTFAADVTVSINPVVQGGDPTSSQSQQQVQLALEFLNVPPPPGVTAGDAVVAQIFELEATLVSGGTVGEDGFLQPVTIAIQLSPEVLLAAGDSAANISLQFYDEAAGTWTAVPCSVSGSTLTCELPHFSVWALVVTVADDTQTGTATPTAPLPAPTGIGSGDSGAGSTLPYLLGAVAAAALLGGAGLRWARKRA